MNMIIPKFPDFSISGYRETVAAFGMGAGDPEAETDEVAAPLSTLFPSSDDDVDDDNDVVRVSAQRFPAIEEIHEPVEQLDIYPLSSIEATVVIRQLRSLGLSFQLWPAATSFVNLLNRHHSNPSTSPLASALISGRRLRILELGSGTGLAGIATAAVLRADVTVTELPHVIENLRFNVEANSEMVVKQGGSVVAAALSWSDIHHMEAVGRDFDTIIASDVVYHDHLYDPLIQTLRYFLIGSGEGEGDERKPMKFVMAHLKRWKKESNFFKKARKLFDVEIIHSDTPSDRCRRGVSFYQFTRKHQTTCAVHE